MAWFAGYGLMTWLAAPHAYAECWASEFKKMPGSQGAVGVAPRLCRERFPQQPAADIRSAEAVGAGLEQAP